jgi:hypothetical protein
LHALEYAKQHGVMMTWLPPHCNLNFTLYMYHFMDNYTILYMRIEQVVEKSPRENCHSIPNFKDIVHSINDAFKCSDYCSWISVSWNQST